MINKEGLFHEIRINEKYAHLSFSQYKNNELTTKSDPITTQRSMLTPDYMSRITYNIDETRLIIPPNCRYIEKTDRGTLVVIEEPPAIRTVSVQTSIKQMLENLRLEDKLKEYNLENYLDENPKKPYQFTLAFPYVIFILFFNERNEYSKANIFVRTQEMSGFSDVLFLMPMLNINSDQDVCFGDRVYKTNQSLYSAVNNVISVWWGAEFNHDYNNNRSVYKKTSIINNYLEWQHYSKENPLFVFNTDWHLYKHNIFQIQ